MKAMWIAGCVLSLCAAPAFAQGAVPPDYNPQNATTVYSGAGVPPDYSPQNAATVAPGTAVPPDYRPAAGAPVESGLRPDLRPAAGQLSSDEQLELLKRNEADIAARREAREALAAREAEQMAAERAAADARRRAAYEKRRGYERQINDSDLEFRAKLNKARANRANEYVDAELEAMKRGAPSPIR